MTIKEIINLWDPLDLLSWAPDDEYSSEIAAIEQLIKTTNDYAQLGEGIYQVFLTAFGPDSFQKTKQECAEIAMKIRTFISSI